jgi:ATP-dependent Clp protease ATP-binding subunit ClpA
VLSIDVANLAWKRGRILERLEETLAETTILSVEDLFDSPDANHIVTPLLVRGASVIGAGTQEGFRRTVETAPVLAGYFHVIEVLPPSEAETETILEGLKSRYERFHEVTIAEGAIHAAIIAARRFPTRRTLPDRAIDVLDEACSRVRVRKQTTVSPQDIEAVLAARRGSNPQGTA